MKCDGLGSSHDAYGLVPSFPGIGNFHVVFIIRCAWEITMKNKLTGYFASVGNPLRR